MREIGNQTTSQFQISHCILSLHFLLGIKWCMHKNVFKNYIWYLYNVHIYGKSGFERLCRQLLIIYKKTNVVNTWHFVTDSDPYLALFASGFKVAKFFCLLFFEGTFMLGRYLVFKDEKL
jgi:hypothetical protein